MQIDSLTIQYFDRNWSFGLRDIILNDPLKSMIKEVIVLDTADSIVYIGKLIEVTEHTFVLDQADMHDCREGHANKEVYLAETRANGVEANRRNVVVMKSNIISVSKLEDIISS